ncbi:MULTISPECIES: toll/interleukin-1 receptor domain-containing protein [Nostoc]|uniref:Toll/interleukin-1 receptor domain-containing protein n=2 Tax=Nostoc TaxID=1177 RepID=A0ABR8I6R4_9NOSO|nr:MULTISPECIES: toll/interleukin-1 receptor domain-containing protein [Nostoc]MBD2560369.1 toll/interleukin-1 receptor domain-containing protein [Nostoc linckia FACHB-391]MBD2646874.1 toll/interleukin-1 receptor domain-containing protein [Nostoc foliaceum FACHB-393]
MPATKVVKVFYCCSDSAQDEEMRQKLENHLSGLKWKGLSTSWHRKMISPGKDWKSEIDTNLKTADIILVLISSDFIASNYHWNVLAKQAMEQHRAKTSRVITILLSPVDNHWKDEFPNVKVLPKGGRPITEWRPYNKAFANIATGIREVAEEFTDSTFLIKKILRWISPIVILIAKAAGNTFIYVARATFLYLFRPSRYRRRNRVSNIAVRLVVLLVLGSIFLRFISQPPDILEIPSSASKPTSNSRKTVNPTGWIWIGMVNNTSGGLPVGKKLVFKPSNLKQLPSIEPPVIPSPGTIVTVKHEVNLMKEKSLSGKTIVKLKKGEKLVILKVERFSKVAKNSPYIKLKAQVRKCNSICNK